MHLQQCAGRLLYNTVRGTLPILRYTGPGSSLLLFNGPRPPLCSSLTFLGLFSSSLTRPGGSSEIKDSSDILNSSEIKDSSELKRPSLPPRAGGAERSHRLVTSRTSERTVLRLMSVLTLLTER